MSEPAPLRFETALAELQQIVTRLEDGSIGLEESLAEFERGVRLLRSCYQILEDAEQKIELLVGFSEEGEPLTEPFDAKATYDATEQQVGRRRSARKPSPPATPDDSSGGLF